MTEREMQDAQAEFAAWDEARERDAIIEAQLTRPEDRTRQQWATLGFVWGPPIYARED